MSKKRKKSLRERIKIDIGENGVAIWLDDRWIIDASCIKDDGTFSLSFDRIKKLWSPKGTNKEFIIEELPK